MKAASSTLNGTEFGPAGFTRASWINSKIAFRLCRHFASLAASSDRFSSGPLIPDASAKSSFDCIAHLREHCGGRKESGRCSPTCQLASLSLPVYGCAQTSSFQMLLCANPQSNAVATDGNHVGTRLRITKSRPGFHERTPLFERITAPVGLFGLVADDMSQSGLRYLARKMRLVSRPIAA